MAKQSRYERTDCPINPRETYSRIKVNWTNQVYRGREEIAGKPIPYSFHWLNITREDVFGDLWSRSLGICSMIRVKIHHN